VERPPNGAQRDSLARAHRSPWRDLPSRYGPWQTVYDRFVRWRKDGTWLRLVQTLQTKLCAQDELDLSVLFVDATVVRASRAAAGGGKRRGPDEPQDHALGRSRGGLSTKLLLTCECHRHVLYVILTAGQASDLTGVVPAL
jgi:transposase